MKNLPQSVIEPFCLQGKCCCCVSPENCIIVALSGFSAQADLSFCADFALCAGRLNVSNEELDEMMKEASGPINFTIFLAMFGEKLKGQSGCL